MMDLSRPKPALAKMYYERAQRMIDGSRGYWDERGVLINDPVKCKKKIQELRETAARLDDPELYETFVEE